MRCGTITGWETLAGYDEGGGVRAEVEEELSNDVEGEESVAVVTQELIVGESDDDEENCEQDETHDLDRFAAESVDGGNADPVSWNGTSAGDDQVTNSGIVVDLVHVVAACVSDG